MDLFIEKIHLEIAALENQVQKIASKPMTSLDVMELFELKIKISRLRGLLLENQKAG